MKIDWTLDPLTDDPATIAFRAHSRKFEEKYARGQAAIKELEWTKKALHLAIDKLPEKELEVCIEHLQTLPEVEIVIRQSNFGDPWIRFVSTKVKDEKPLLIGDNGWRGFDGDGVSVNQPGDEFYSRSKIIGRGWKPVTDFSTPSLKGVRYRRRKVKDPTVEPEENCDCDLTHGLHDKGCPFDK